MQIRDLLRETAIDRQDAEALLGYLLDRDRAWLLAHDDATVTPDVRAQFTAMARRHAQGEPMAYILGEAAFHGRLFHVGPGVLIPRVCTETLVALTYDILDTVPVEPIRSIDDGIVAVAAAWGACDDVRTIVDVGTGSGCIAITLACERPERRCIAIDRSPQACATARDNARRHGVDRAVDVREGDLLDPLQDFDQPFVIVSNPPYVMDPTLLADDVREYEPHEALFGGGADGGELLRRLAVQATRHPFCRGMVVECLASQGPMVQALLPT